MKTAQDIGKKASTKIAEKYAEKIGEKTGQVVGENIYDKFSKKNWHRDKKTCHSRKRLGDTVAKIMKSMSTTSIFLMVMTGWYN